MHPKLKQTLSKYDTIILVGGGTGGHIQPILNIAEEGTDKEFLWIGGKDSNEQNEAEKARVPFQSISTLKLSTTKSPKALLYPFLLVRGIYEAYRILNNHKNGNSCVFSKGGPGSVAIGIAAWTLSIPLYIHESDTVPGRSNRILGKFANTVFLGFENTKKYFDEEKCKVIGQILHPIFSKPVNQSRNKPAIKWQTTKPHILVICGSQGAKSIFEAIIDQFKKNNPYEWIIALGKLNSDKKRDFEEIGNTQAVEWLPQEDIAHLLQDTAIAITRGSATTLAEIDVFGVKKIIIPLPYAADNHQYWNAREYEKTGDILLEQKNLDTLKEILEKYDKTENPHAHSE